MDDTLGKFRAGREFVVEMQSVVIARKPGECCYVLGSDRAAETFRLTDAEFIKTVWLQCGVPLPKVRDYSAAITRKFTRPFDFRQAPRRHALLEARAVRR
jgi:hypothetical protein